MKINEVEAQVGITKKNIRFYEEQGLLSPRRNSENGYRDYGEAEVAVLRQIKLMRKLGVPLEEIRKMQAGGTVADGMRRHLVTLERDRKSLEQSILLCQSLKDREERLDALDAAALLEEMEQLEQTGTTFQDKQKGDAKPARYAGAIVMALLTSMNSTYGMAVGPYMKATKDGWLPDIFGKTNKNGAPVLILTIQLVVGCIPIILGFSVGTIVNNIMVITSVFQFLLFVAIFQTPKKMPKKWAANSAHLSSAALYVVVAVACVAQAFILFYSMKSLTVGLAIFNVVAVIVCFVYAIWRHRSGKTHVVTENMLDD